MSEPPDLPGEEPVELYDMLELPDMEDEFDYVVRGLTEGTSVEELVHELRRREWSRASAERYIHRTAEEVESIFGSEERYAEVLRKYNNRLTIGLLGLILSPIIIVFTYALGLGFLLLPTGMIVFGLGLVIDSVSTRSKLRRRRAMWLKRSEETQED